MRKKLTTDEFVKGVEQGETTILAQAISLVESNNPDHEIQAREMLGKIKVKNVGKVLGISGTPGVGKSTFIEAFGMSLIESGLKVAVLAIDPTSVKTGGSILGDKTRMQNLSAQPSAFIRPSASRKTLGGVTSKTREAIFLCEAAGFDVILVETVGVGQSELTVGQMVDFFLLLMQPGSGDDLQGIKRGILEVCDLLAINKADGDLLNRANLAKSEFELALKILREKDGQVPKVFTCSAQQKTGLSIIWDEIESFYQRTDIAELRKKQLHYWLDGLINEKITNFVNTNKNIQSKKDRALEDVWNRKTSVHVEAAKLVDELIRGNFGNN